VSVARETLRDANLAERATVSRETVGEPNLAELSGVARETATKRGRPSRISALILLPIRAYRRFLSPALTPRCRYHPSCSAYAEEAIRELGAVRGTILALWRLLRCNPFSGGGLDPLAERRFFRPSRTPERTETA